jgi:hypothetical protein
VSGYAHVALVLLFYNDSRDNIAAERVLEARRSVGKCYSPPCFSILKVLIRRLLEEDVRVDYVAFLQD